MCIRDSRQRTQRDSEQNQTRSTDEPIELHGTSYFAPSRRRTIEPPICLAGRQFSICSTATVMSTSAPMVFVCTPGGAIAAGRRRVGRLLLGATLLMLVLAVVMSFGGRWGPAVVCVGAAFLAFLAWRM